MPTQKGKNNMTMVRFIHIFMIYSTTMEWQSWSISLGFFQSFDILIEVYGKGVHVFIFVFGALITFYFFLVN